MALNFGILQPVDISGQMMAGKQQAQQNQLAQQQLRQSEMSTQHSQMQMEQLQRDRDALAKLQEQFVANGKSPNLEENFSAMIQSGIPHFVDVGTQGLQKIQQQKQFANIVGGGATPVAAPTASVNALAPTAEGIAPIAPVNALAPTAAPMGNAQAQIAAAYQLGTPAALAWAKSQEDRMKPVTGAAGGFVYNPQTQSFMQAPEKTPAPAAPPSMVAEYQFAKTPDGGGYVGTYEKFVRDRAVAARPPGAPAQPVAPTIAQIVDPANPNQMITIDARRYQGGGAGSPGVIGVAGKEPSAALRTNKVEAGKSQLADDLANLRASFATLDQMRAVPSTERNVLSNIGSATAASGIGQMLGRAGGTEAQVERDVINSARLRLVNSIKNATGMSAQQLNSNVELQTMLKSISDPGQSLQAAMRIIDDIESAYITGDGKLPKRGAPSAVSGKVIPAAGSVDTSNPLLK